MEDFKGRIGIDREQSTYKQYEIFYKQLKQFLREEYHIEDIPLTELDLPFIEALNFFFRVKRKMNPTTVKIRIIKLNKVICIAFHRNIIIHPPSMQIITRNKINEDMTDLAEDNLLNDQDILDDEE